MRHEKLRRRFRRYLLLATSIAFAVLPAYILMVQALTVTGGSLGTPRFDALAALVAFTLSVSAISFSAARAFADKSSEHRLFQLSGLKLLALALSIAAGTALCFVATLPTSGGSFGLEPLSDWLGRALLLVAGAQFGFTWTHVHNATELALGLGTAAEWDKSPNAARGTAPAIDGGMTTRETRMTAERDIFEDKCTSCRATLLVVERYPPEMGSAPKTIVCEGPNHHRFETMVEVAPSGPTRYRLVQKPYRPSEVIDSFLNSLGDATGNASGGDYAFSSSVWTGPKATVVVDKRGTPARRAVLVISIEGDVVCVDERMPDGSLRRITTAKAANGGKEVLRDQRNQYDCSPRDFAGTVMIAAKNCLPGD